MIEACSRLCVFRLVRTGRLPNTQSRPLSSTLVPLLPRVCLAWSVRPLDAVMAMIDERAVSLDVRRRRYVFEINA